MKKTDASKKEKVILTWKCGYCGSVQVSDSSKRHSMDFCKCRESAVDLEQWYQRNVGNVIEIKREVLNG
jgi:endogenous inhibitor of DNA gyrase (YacG/DUF329 family)